MYRILLMQHIRIHLPLAIKYSVIEQIREPEPVGNVFLRNIIMQSHIALLRKTYHVICMLIIIHNPANNAICFCVLLIINIFI